MHLVTILLQNFYAKAQTDSIFRGTIGTQILQKISNNIKSSTHLTPKIYSEEYNTTAQNTIMKLCVS
jgi:hypothetical protein